ncbi:MAG: PstS family phosphate ABC transporter substrate-binding protein [Spirochaetota bacterium]|nr:PstS family phosphate ABC transporter substrate-binding protein [Spirochaetota bacterium]
MRIKSFIMLLLLVTFSFIYCGGRKTSTNISISGSDTMLELGKQWALLYEKQHKGQTIQINGGGSGVGINALIQGRIDLANASREIKPEEIKRLEKKKWKLITYKTALDGLSIYINEKNPINELSFEQLKRIYTGEITNWKQIGGKDSKIILYGRQNSSGTYAYFRDNVLLKKDYSPTVQELSGTGSIVRKVAQDIDGIGYGGKAYTMGVKVVKVKVKDSDIAYAPTDENVASGKYPLTRDLYIYTTDKVLNGKKKGDAVEKYIQWISSEEGQKIVKDVGYYPVKKTN